MAWVWVNFKLSLAGEDTSQGSQPWSVSTPATALQKNIVVNETIYE